MVQTNQERTLPPSISIPSKFKRIAKTIQFFSTNLATKFSSKLFSTPVKFPKPEREKMMWESAKKTRLKITSINKEIEVLTYGFSKKKVLLVHGWCGRSTQLFMIADKLLENGYMVISFDAPAHGNSEGKNALMPEFIDTIHQINESLGPFDTAVGHSLGGMSLYSAVEEGFSLKSLVTVGAGDTISAVMNNFIKNLDLKPKIALKLKKHYDEIHQVDIDSYSSSTKAKGVTIPTLVIHDSADGDVPVSCAYNIRQNLQQGSILITHGLGHTKILRDKNTTSRIVEFIKNNP